MLQSKDGAHESAVGRADERPVCCVGKDGMELRHAFFEGAGEIWREHTREPFAKETRFAAVAIAVRAVKIDQAARVHLAFVAGVFLRAPGEYLGEGACEEQPPGYH